MDKAQACIRVATCAQTQGGQGIHLYFKAVPGSVVLAVVLLCVLLLLLQHVALKKRSVDER